MLANISDGTSTVKVPQYNPVPNPGANAGFGGQTLGVQIGGQTTTLPTAVQAAEATQPAPTPNAPAPSAPSAPAQGAITVGAYKPDWATILSNDPGVAAVRNAGVSAEQTAAAQRRAAIQRAVIAYGGLPAGFSDQYGDVDPATLQLAKANQNSTTALQAHQYASQVRQLQQALAARGMLGSGELGYNLDEAGRANSTALYNAGNTLADQYTGAVGGYTGVLGQNARDLANAYQTAEATDSQLPQYQPNAGTQAAYDPTLSRQYGATVYTDPGDGRNYTLDANGNPVLWYRPVDQAPAGASAQFGGVGYGTDYNASRLY